ncbi:MAG TPA: preprotein translocase subunit SecA [Ktedonobacterales bacterium]|nr:preprotein translocase subunit SecA [Ktedonobacterales bacterium]
MSFITKILGDPNERELKRMRPIVERINNLEDEMRALDDGELRAMTGEFKQELENGAGLDDILPDAFAVVREAGRRTIGMRHFDVQLIGGIVLHEGKIAEMRTGEGKTLVATLPSYLNALTGKGVHIVTVNDYLVKRDRDWMGRIHEFLGLSCGVVLTSQNPQSAERRAAYAADITYATNNELGFDYLRDHMVPDLSLCAQRGLNFAIVDEVDNILIDEARTPLIISGQADESAELYKTFARAVPRLKAETDYEIDPKTRTVAITQSGIDKIERMLGVENIYNDMDLTRHLENALKAHALFKRDKDYLVRDGEVLIVDEFTGRVLQGRRYSEGLHQAIEAKENVTIQRENRTLATITFQNYFRLYEKLAGMTGTAITEAEEFHKIYKLDVIVVPTNKPINRTDHTDSIYRTEKGKFAAVAREIRERHEAGQPVLVGTTSVELSEYLSGLLDYEGIQHDVLNAKQHAREAQVVAQAGRGGSVTIATNMAGRGTDIVLGGNPEGFVEQILRERDIDPEFATEEDRAEALEEARKRCDEDRAKVIEAGGLYIIGTERHESRRIDNQLRGRSGRQGDPGESRFFLSLEDELLRRSGIERASGLLQKLGMDDEMPIEAKMVSNMLEQAQAKVEGFNFDIRKNVVEYDDVIAAQRAAIYEDRQAVLAREDMHERVLQMIEHEVRRVVQAHTAAPLAENWDLDGIVKQFDAWQVHVPDDVFPEQITRLRRDTLMNALVEVAKAGYQAKEEFVIQQAKEMNTVESGDFYMRQFERMVVLQVVDALWQDHIDQMDVMRSGIGLRGVAQRDPLVEFKREAYQAFEQLKLDIEHHVVDLLYRGGVQVRLQEPPAEALPKNLHTNADAMAKMSGQVKGVGNAAAKPKGLPAAARPGASRPAAKNASATQPNGRHPATAKSGSTARAPQPATAAAARGGTASASGVNGLPSRNQPCPCGSGRKYKQCHGR